jgi:diacylglycerol kinase (ATP)
MKQLGKDSIRQMELMRFYLQLKQDPHGPNLALFVGNLPPNLSERNYENILTEFLGKGNVSCESLLIGEISSERFRKQIF